MAILPVALCRRGIRNLPRCFPIGKYLFTVFTFVVLLNYRKQTPCQRFKDVFRNFGCIHAVWDLQLNNLTYSGTWESDGNTLMLTQNGVTIQGTYDGTSLTISIGLGSFSLTQ